MDHPIARRRVSRILSHVTSIDPTELSSLNLFPLNCSSSLNSMVRRCDNTLLFARQGSAAQAYFMQQASVKQLQNPTLGNFPSESGDPAYQNTGEPLFSRQACTHFALPTSKSEQFVRQDSTPSSIKAPQFARQYNEESENKQLTCCRTSQVPLSKGMAWSPRIDVAESGSNYVVTVELPGVSIMDIRVEVDDHKLIVTGKRSNHRLEAANGNENPNLKYHRREILQGPYRVFWPLPHNVNKDMVSAEFVLIVTGKRSNHRLEAANGNENPNLKYHRREILQGPYRVFWPLPHNVNKDMVSAEFVNGFLRITLPKF